MTFFSMLKYNSRLALRGHWPKAVFVAVAAGLLAGVLSLLQQQALDVIAPVPGISQILPAPPGESPAVLFRYAWYVSMPELAVITLFTLLSIFLVAPISLGVRSWFWSLVQGEPESIAGVFRFFESFRAYRRAVWYELTMTVRALFWVIPFLLFPTGMFGASYYLLVLYQKLDVRYLAVASTVGMVLSFFLLVLFLFLYFAFMNRYALSTYYLCEDEQMSVSRAIKASIGGTRGYRFNMLWFHLSFAGWLLLSLLFLLLPLLFFIPYLNTATAMYSRYLMERGVVEHSSSTKEFLISENVPEL